MSSTFNSSANNNSGNKAASLINRFNANNNKNPTTINNTSGFNVIGNASKDSKPNNPISLINKIPNSVINSHVKEEKNNTNTSTINPNPSSGLNKAAKTKEELEEEKRLKREKMKLKMGNSTKKLLAKKEEEKNKEAENQKANPSDNIKIKSLANMFEGKIAHNPFSKLAENKPITSSGMNEKLNKLYGGGMQQEKEIELEDNNNEDNDKFTKANRSGTGTIQVRRRITVTKLDADIPIINPIDNQKKNEDEGIQMECSKPRTMTQVKKFKKRDFKLDK